MLFDDSGVFDEFDKVFARSVHDRDFDTVEQNKAIIHARAAQSRQQMFARRKHDTFPQKRCCITAMRDIFDGRGNFEVVEIGADENVTRIFRRGTKFEIYVNARVQADSADRE